MKRLALLLAIVIGLGAVAEAQLGRFRMGVRMRGHASVGEGPHEFFEEAVSSQYHYESASLRSQASIEEVHHGVNGLPAHTHTNYIYPNDPFSDPNDGTKIDAAKIVMPDTAESSFPVHTNYEQLRIPLNFGALLLGVEETTLLTCWDMYYDVTFITETRTPPVLENDFFRSYKAFQFSAGPNDAINWEVRTRFMGRPMATNAAWTDVRTYCVSAPECQDPPATHGGPGTIFDHGSFENNYGSDAIGPMENEFNALPNIWTRYCAHHRFRDDTTYAYTSLYVADETRDPVTIFENLGMKWNYNEAGQGQTPGYIEQFWVEFNHSQDREGGGEFIMFVRNIVMLRDVPDVSAWLRKPVRNK